MILGRIRVERIGSIEALEGIEPEWTALIERVEDATPFSRPEWLVPWWRELGSGEMHVLALREGSRLAGLAPLFIHEWQGRRQVTLIANGITDYLDVIAEPELATDCALATFDYLSACADQWDVCDWQDLGAHSALLTGVVQQHACELCESLPCTRAILPPDADAYEASLPHGLRRTIRVATRRLERDGELRFETIREDPEATVLQQLFRLHESRWAPKGGPESMLDSPGAQRFLTAATRRFSGAGKLRLFTMCYSGALAAIIYGILDRGRMWGYITGMDPALSRYSPGSLVLEFAMREAIREGATAWEFLRGDEPYKFLWGATLVPKSRLIWRSPKQLSYTSPR
jgi:CelD/BcsL family acetyltransferase involved in cellulose biosynthesis